MSFVSLCFCLSASRSDKKRDAAIPLPEGVTQCRNISYGSFGQQNLLDVYYPEGTEQPLPTIVSIHGGGYVYGSKEIYRRYGMDMARRGFAFVNFNYRLAPKWKFPAPLHDTNAVLHWVVQNARRYHLDPNRIILLGDSAGAQLASQYAAICTNPEYADCFSMKLPKITLRAVGLFCGVYAMSELATQPRKGLHADYLGKDLPADDPRFRVLENITSAFPPAFVATFPGDFLRECALPMAEHIASKGVEVCHRCFGDAGNKQLGHVYHINILKPEAVACNDEAAAFFRRFV